MKKTLVFLIMTITLLLCLTACKHEHSFGEWSVTKNPTCTEDGVKTRYCDCGEKQSDVIPTIDHELETISGREATCTEEGLTEGKKCFVCGTVIVEQTETDKTGHDFGKWITVMEATTVDGLKERTCACGEKETKVIPAVLSDGLEYTLNSDGKGYSVTGIGTCTDVNIVVPSKYNDLPITSIGDFAFENCVSLESIFIPDGVISIGEQAFWDCTSLLHVTIPDSVTSIGTRAFGRCDSLQYNEYAKGCYLGNESNPYRVLVYNRNSEIHTETKIICSFAYYKEAITSITIPKSVISIGDYAFSGCSLLVSISIPESVKSIGDHVFEYCSSLTSINFAGTIEQWNGIEKTDFWNAETGEYAIYCCDGTLEKNSNSQNGENEDDVNKKYVILVVDQNGDAVIGAKVQMLSHDVAYIPQVTDKNGEAYYNTEEGHFRATVIYLPEGYKELNDDYVYLVDRVATIVVYKVA